MKSLLAIALIPLGFAASFARPFLSFAGFAFLVSWAWAYVNPAWVDVEFTNRILGMAVACYSTRYTGDLLQNFIANRL